jgi:acyl-CoA synthetase (AMP-forming)/AMP-acid ligase II
MLPHNAISRLFQNAEAFPDRLAVLTQDDKAWTYSDILTMIQKMRAGLRKKGLRKGDCVGIMAKPSLQTLILFSSLVAEGVASVLVDPALSMKDIFWSLRHSRCTSIWGDRDVLRVLWLSPSLWPIPRVNISAQFVGSTALTEPPLPMNDEDLVFLSYTSGSTGRPKAVPRNHSTLIHQQCFSSRYLPPLASDIHLCGYTISALQSLIDGATTILPRKTLEQNLQVLRKYNCTRISGPPGFLMDFCRFAEKNHETWSSPLSVLTGGGPLSNSFAQRLQNVFPQARIHLIYGSTECEPIAFVETHQIQSDSHRGYCVGKPLPELEVGLFSPSDLQQKMLTKCSVGEVCVSGPSVVKKYFDSPHDEQQLKVPDSQGRIWHRTGDIGEWDSEGKLWLLGRYAYSGKNFFNGAIEAELENSKWIERAAFFLHQEVFHLALQVHSEVAPALQFAQEVLQHQGLSNVPIHAQAKALPVDPRHRWKIQRQKIAQSFL